MASVLKTACIQTNAQGHIAENLKQVGPFIREAAARGATFIATPENTCRMRATREGRFEESAEQDQHPAVHFYSGLARELKIHLLIGSISSIRMGERLANRSFLFTPNGTIAAMYDKIHMFDVVPPNGEIYRESDTHEQGDEIVLAQAEGIKVGLSICYDVRFPDMYRAMAKAGAGIFTIPAAFTVPTGKAHWETLLRARAIENGAFVVAPAQCGTHEGGRGTWGHSMIVSPWGDILAKADDSPGIIMADIEIADVEKARAAIPSLKHDRKYFFKEE